jgi:hypothetical protein
MPSAMTRRPRSRPTCTTVLVSSVSVSS